MSGTAPGPTPATPGTAPQTPSQTVGPYFSMVLASDDAEAVMATADTPGELVRIRGRLLDGDGAPIEDGLLELWQADAQGRYHHPLDGGTDADDGFTGFGRCRSAFDGGGWEFTTVRPGRVAGPGGAEQAPHVSLVVQSRGMLDPIWTRVYFGDEDDANAQDPVLQQVPDERRATLLAARSDGDDGVPVFTLDLRVQGEGETVLLDW